MKQLAVVLALIALAVPALADINPIYRNPQPPQDIDRAVEPQPDGPQRSILPGYPDPSSSLPVGVVPGELQIDYAPVIDPLPGRPSYGEPVKNDGGSLDLPSRSELVGVSGERFGNGLVPIRPPSLFRNEISIQFAPELGPLSGNVRLIGMDGRVAAEERFSSASGVVLSDIGSLPSGSYVVSVDCGPGKQFLGRSLKLD